VSGHFDPAEKQQLQLAAASSARLSNPRMYWRELGFRAELLEPDEDVLDVFACYCGRLSMSAGLLFETDRRLVFVSFGFLRRKPIVRSIEFDEIMDGHVEMVGRDPDVILTLKNGKRLPLQGTRPDRQQFPRLHHDARETDRQQARSVAVQAPVVPEPSPPARPWSLALLVRVSS
jgi:hypothetical protein